MPVGIKLIDLGLSPVANAYPHPLSSKEDEPWYPLQVVVCDSCWLVQVDQPIAPEVLFTDDYGYLSSTSTSWLGHASAYCDAIARLLDLDSNSFVLEVASNDGYLLRNFVERRIPCMGIEPTHAAAVAARGRGVPTLQEFLNPETVSRISQTCRPADLIVGNNVLAHVPFPQDLLSSMEVLLADGGLITLEFPYLLDLIRLGQFDTIYHEHFSYLSLSSVSRLARSADLEVRGVEHLATHGGSVRVYLRRFNDTSPTPFTDVYADMLSSEMEAGITDPKFYTGFEAAAVSSANALREFVLRARRSGKRVAAYGASAKGNTFFNFAGLNANDVALVADRSHLKQGRLLPGSRIPVVSEAQFREFEPDYTIVTPWNLKSELTAQLEYVSEWGGSLVFGLPTLEVNGFAGMNARELDSLAGRNED